MSEIWGDMKTRTVLLAVVLAFAAIGPSFGGTSGVLHGYVREDDGSPSVHALVTASAPVGTFQRRTDRNGFFVFLALPPGLYTVSVEKPGRTPVSVAGVRINSDQSRVLALHASRSFCPPPTAVTIASDQRTDDYVSVDVQRMALSPPGFALITLPEVVASRPAFCL